MKKLFCHLIFLFLILGWQNAFSSDETQEAALFSLIVYDDWKNPSKPLPQDWQYLLKAPDELRTSGYMGMAFLNCVDPNNCRVVIAHRGTTLSIFDYYEDFLIFLERTPDYYTQALKFVQQTQNYLNEHHIKYGYILNTGHSLGALLAELVQATLGDNIASLVFESPGAKNLIKEMILSKKLPPNALENATYYTGHLFANPNAINTTNEQLDDAGQVSYYIPYEDFSKVPAETMGSPGPIYYFINYSLNQHKISNFYDALTNQRSFKQAKVTSNKWPVGFRDGYKYYLNFDSVSSEDYWTQFMKYIWDHSSIYQQLYNNNYYEYEKAFKVKLAEERNGFYVSTSTSISYPKMNSASNDPLPLILLQGRSLRSSELQNIYRKSTEDRKLYYAVLLGDEALCNSLLIHGANPNTIHGSGRYSLLQIAEMLGQFNIVKLLLNNHANPNLIDIEGNNALHTAAKERDNDAPKYFSEILKYGGDKNATNHSGLTPFKLLQKRRR